MQQTNLERLLRGLVDWLKRAWTEITQNLPGVKEGLPWIVLMITVWIYLTVATDVIWGRSHG